MPSRSTWQDAPITTGRPARSAASSSAAASPATRRTATAAAPALCGPTPTPLHATAPLSRGDATYRWDQLAPGHQAAVWELLRGDHTRRKRRRRQMVLLLMLALLLAVLALLLARLVTAGSLTALP